jgi:hypothetical protein
MKRVSKSRNETKRKEKAGQIEIEWPENQRANESA